MQRTLLVVLISALASTVGAAVITVTTTAPSGPGSLQQAIIDANAMPDLDTIAFGIGPDDDMVKTIFVTNNLTSLTGPTIIDGYTQSGSSSNTLATGNNAVLLIEVTSTNNSQGFNITGGGCTVRGLVLNGFYDTGFQFGNPILIQAAATNNVIEGNFIGTDATGTNDSPRITFIGVNVNSPGNRIGGTLPGARNVIGGCISDAILLTGSAGTNNTVQGSYIGTDKTGTEAIANGRGIRIESAFNQIGGTTAGAGNLISGNTGYGLYIIASTNVLEGNFIGLDVTGSSKLPNGNNGVALGGNGTVNGNRIGGTSTAARNVISGNAGRGIVMSGVLSNAVLGNFIGTDVTGSNALPNSLGGIHMDLDVGPVIGGSEPGAGNVIAGNGGTGISFTRGSDLQIDGNFIGTDLTGMLDLGNANHGVDANSSVSTINIGVGSPNTIAFNGSGLFNAGVALSSGAISNNVTGNLIYSNTGPGVFLFQGVTQTRISDNSIFDNGQLGILLGFSLNPNDPCDTDVGDNDLQNFPVITAATSDASSVTIAGFLPSAASTAFDLEFFANATCDPTGFGEGELFIGTTNVTTGANCTNNFNVTFLFPVPGGLIITATATDPNGNTSEFSACFTNQALITCSQSENTNDVWDVRQGVTLTASSGAGSGALENMFGATLSSAEPGTAFFRDDQTNGFTHFVEWQTPTPVLVTNFNLIAYHDAVDNLQRAFKLFNLYGFNASNSTFELLFTLTPPLPYGQEPDGRFLYACRPVLPLATDKFRAEFIQAIDASFPGPRVIELDGFGTVLEAPCPTITLSPSTLPNGTVGIPYNQTITASGSSATPFNFTVTQGTPPSGINLSSAGTLSGTPSAPVTSGFTVTATDTNNCTGSRNYMLTINAAPPEAHDLAIIRLHVIKNINLSAAKPALTKRVVVQIQNRSSHDEVITNLAALISVTLSNIQASSSCTPPPAVLIDGPPNQPGRVLKPKQKLNVFFEVMFNTNCVPDATKSTRTDPGHEDYAYRAEINHSALDGNADTHIECDTCPRPPLPGGVDPNPDPAKPLKDKGCGNKDKATGLLGAPVLTDVVIKQ